MNNNGTSLDKFKNNVGLIKKQIVKATKDVSKAIRDVKHAKSENDKQALLVLISKRRKDLESYKLTLDDLTYAFVKSRPFYGQKIVSKFGYKTVDGYLADKQNGDQPSLKRMMEVITTGLLYIPTIYSYSWTEDGRKVLNRDFSKADMSTKVQRDPDYSKPAFSSGDPIKDTHDVRMVASVVSSASRHR